MILQSDVVAKITTLKEYSDTTAPKYKSYFDALVKPLETIVTTYFLRDNSSLNAILKELTFWWYCDIARRTTKYTNEFDKGLPTDFPLGYNDLEDCFYKFTELLTIDNETFYQAWVYGEPETDTTGTGEQVPLSNPYSDKWVAEITAAIKGDITNVQTLSDWVQYASGNSDLVSLFEDEGKITEHLTIKEIANQIYITKKMLNVIITLNLSVYVPSYIKKQ